MAQVPEGVEDIMEHPHLYGLPTFEEFCKNKSRWMKDPEEALVSIDAGDKNLRCKQEYFVEKYKVKSLEAAAYLMIEMAGSVDAFKCDPQVVPSQDHESILRVTFLRKRDTDAKL